MAISIGNTITSTNNWPTNYFLIDKANPANGSGTIDTINIYSNNASTLDVGFYSLSGGVLTLRSSTRVTTTGTGSHTFTGLSLAVQAGDYIGVFVVSGGLGTYAGSANLLYKTDTALQSSISQSSFTANTTWFLAVNGTGSEAGKKINSILIGKWNSINPSKWNGI